MELEAEKETSAIDAHFTEMDVSGDECISKEELHTYLVANPHVARSILGLDVDAKPRPAAAIAQTSTQEAKLIASHVELIFSRLDLDGSGKVSKAEWRVASLAQRHEVVSAALRPLFEHMDTNGSGKLELSEVHSAMVALLEGAAASGSRSTTGRPADEVAALLKEHDLNQDGSLDFTEFCTMMMGSFESSVRRKSKRRWSEETTTLTQPQEAGGCALL